jgi:hypothetical protein
MNGSNAYIDNYKLHADRINQNVDRFNSIKTVFKGEDDEFDMDLSGANLVKNALIQDAIDYCELVSKRLCKKSGGY